MKRYSVLFLFLCVFGHYARGQFLDSIQTALTRKARFSFGFNSRNSFITNYKAHIWGFTVGVCFDRKIALGGGFNTLNDTIEENTHVEGQNVTAKLNFQFMSYYVEYLCKLSRHWEIDIPVSIGLGSSSFSYSLAGKPLMTDKQTVIPIEPSVEVDYNFNKYWGLCVQAGYRWMLINNKNIDDNFNSPTYSFGVLIYPFEIYVALFPHTGLAHIIENN